MTFWMMFALLLVVASGFLALPFLSHRRRVIKNASAEFSIERANVTIFRDQQAQLQRQLDNSEISKEQFDQLTTDAKQLLLTNTAQQTADPQQRDNAGFWLLPVLVVLLTLSSWFIYNALGAQADEDILQLINQRADASVGAEATEQ